MKLLLILLAATLPSNTQAESPAAHFEAKCKLGSTEFKITFASKSGDPTSDDMTATFTGASGSTPLAVKAGLYHPGRATVEKGGPESVCDTLPAFAMGKRVLVFLTRDNRPGFPRLSVALIDPAQGRTIHALESIADFKRSDLGTPYVVRKGKAGFHTRLVREVLESGSDGAENYIEDWNVIQVAGNRILSKWRDPLGTGCR